MKINRKYKIMQIVGHLEKNVCANFHDENSETIFRRFFIKKIKILQKRFLWKTDQKNFKKVYKKK